MKKEIEILYDSNEVIYKLGPYKHKRASECILFDREEDEKIQPYNSLKALRPFFIGKSIDSCLSADYSNFSQDLITQSALLSILQQIYWDRGDRPLADKKELKGLICPCSAITSKDIETAYKENLGDEKKVRRSLKLGLICDSCNISVDKELLRLNERYFKKEEMLKVENKVKDLLSEFSFYSPSDFEGVIISLDKIDVGKIRLRVERPHFESENTKNSDKKRLDKKRALEVLEQYIGEEVTKSFKLSVIMN